MLHIHAYCKNTFQVFLVFHMYVASVLSGVAYVCNDFSSVFQVFS
jgi:hypothetical protein